MRQEATRANQRLMATGCGLLLLALAFGWSGAAGSAEVTGRAVPVCIGADRVLQLVGNDEPCYDGGQRFLLASAAAASPAEASQKKPAPKVPAPQPAPRPSNSGGQTTRFTAPFEIVDRQGAPILRVEEEGGESSRGLYLLNAAGNVLVQATGFPGADGGRVQVRNGKSKVGPWVGLGYPEEGPVIAMKTIDGKNLFMANTLGLVWFNAQEIPAVKLGVGESGKAGYFTIADEKGAQVVEAGSLKDGRGIVRVFPNKGQTAPIPQFIMGGKP